MSTPNLLAGNVVEDQSAKISLEGADETEVVNRGERIEFNVRQHMKVDDRSMLKEIGGVRVQAARRDYDDGMLFDLRAMVAAEVLGGFIEQAQALLVQGYYAPAASLAGAVLEDTLRKLCDVKSIPYPEKTTINFLNTELTRATVYDLLINKQIIAYADIRKGLA